MLKIFKTINKKIKKKIEECAQKNINEITTILNRPKEGEIVKIENIKIPYYYSIPNKKKLKEREEYYKKHDYFRSTIVLDKNNMITNGYTTYLLALNYGYDYITIVRKD